MDLLSTYYELLDVLPDAEDFEAQVNKKYRRLSLQHHPDKGGSETLFKRLNRAHKVLSDPEKRKQYDLYGIDTGEDEEGTGKSTEVLGYGVLKSGDMMMARTILGGLFVYLERSEWWLWRLVPIPLAALMLAYGMRVMQATDEESFVLKVQVTAAGQRVLIITVLGFFAPYLWVLQWAVEALALLTMPSWDWLIFPPALYQLLLAVGNGSYLKDGGGTKLDIAWGVGRVLGSMVLSWWFDGRGWYYVYLFAAQMSVLFIVFLFFMFAGGVAESFVQSRLQKYARTVLEERTLIKEERKAIIAEKETLQQRVEELEAEIQKMKSTCSD